jgi:hypothetical protein
MQYMNSIDRFTLVGYNWHILRITRHKINKARGDGSMLMRVLWVGLLEELWEPERSVKRMNPELLKEYWMSLGGRG